MTQPKHSLETLQCTTLNCDDDTKMVDNIQSLSQADHILQDYNNIYSNNYMNIATNTPYVNFDNGFGGWSGGWVGRARTFRLPSSFFLTPW